MQAISSLFTPACPLTSGHLRFNHDADGFERNLRATITAHTLVDFAPLSSAPFRQRSTGWNTGSVGVTIGEQSAIKLETTRSEFVRLCVPVRGSSHYLQGGLRASSQAGQSWVYLSDQGVSLRTSDDHAGVALSLSKAQLQHTVRTMAADPSDVAADHMREIDLHTPEARQGLRMLPTLLGHLQGVRSAGPDAVRAAEDVAYRFVAYLLADPETQRREVLTVRRSRQVVDTACSFMMARLDHPPTLTTVELEVGVSARTLQSAFAQHLGAAPGDWFKWQRYQVAHHLLRTRQVASVTEAALACGFPHLGRFAVEFRARFGQSPSELLGPEISN
jgi:AraC-like DNA-binding protein